MRTADVIIPPNHPNPPEPHEVETAWILARHFKTVVEFIIPVNSYKVKTSDVVLNGILWEIKSPKGSSKTTVGNQFKSASKQRARYIIFDASRIAIKEEDVIVKVHHELQQRRSIRRILLIKKDKTVVEIVRKK